ncbi:hypothetical protein GWI33_008228 [Rhynchophorus ferrugineus]|uniref:Uncharacterized protein n=1 Tax=Rhynchophorus ferrugineus TaxID=354439 RepID=A0A834IEX4_RHYFE|nr:hypothetical protein GWI33_008228 [Rhynchophorus ferrugineus]
MPENHPRTKIMEIDDNRSKLPEFRRRQKPELVGGGRGVGRWAAFDTGLIFDDKRWLQRGVAEWGKGLDGVAVMGNGEGIPGEAGVYEPVRLKKYRYAFWLIVIV